MAAASETKYLDPEKLYQLKKWRRSFWNWHADLFKYETPSYGPNIFIGFCGAKVAFGADTVWHDPVIGSVTEFPQIHFDQGNPYWRALLESIDYGIKNTSGKMLFGLPDFGGPADWISAVMGTENFLLACVEKPEQVSAFALRLAEECLQAFDLTYKIISRANDGSVNWMPVWSAECLGTVQDDMAINFSPKMYTDIFRPAIKKLSGHTKKTVLHWHDGCRQHIDWLLAEKDIDLIQFGHDPNTGSFRDQIDHMRSIQNADKKLFISCVAAADAEFFIDRLDPHGLMMIINTDSDAASAKMVHNVKKWTGQRLQRK